MKGSYYYIWDGTKKMLQEMKKKKLIPFRNAKVVSDGEGKRVRLWLVFERGTRLVHTGQKFYRNGNGNVYLVSRGNIKAENER